ncbi:iq calmodulin-binding motif protein [Mycena maculata]|uniref:Iq calmodulin-binding motif protein n=1 Tax=Mycena maculata TaxID=230809 RepID=A0AAD7MZY6_9AGAR|nr:iq calmodulin-binding motif protein [Mycena maculata]
MISPKVYELCTSTETVSSILAKDPGEAPGNAWKKLYGHHSPGTKESIAKAREHRAAHTAEDLKKARECGKWGATEPSELFLKLYHDSLCTLDHSVASAMVSPPLMGSSGTIPLSVISVVPDIMRHMSNLIVRADKEVFLATNYWQNSVASKYITNAMKELSRRAGERGTKVVMKIEYDRGSPRQVLQNHYIVAEKEYTGKNVGMPAPEEIPNIDLQVMNYHRPMLGTFHCKYMIVDRKYAVLQSNNIQDNDNVEMMTHLEGPIVDSLYDMALISWHLKLTPNLPSADHPEVDGGLGSIDDETAQGDIATGPTTAESVVHPVGQSSSQANEAMSDNKSNDQLNYQSQVKGPDEATKVFLYSGQQGISAAQITHPSPEDAPLPEHTTDDPHYDTDIAGEIARVQTSVSPHDGLTRMEAVTKHLNHTKNPGFKGTAPPRGKGEEFTPYIPHPTSESFPIAMVCREPHGTPDHESVYNPQNEVWLSALRNAKKNVFIQSPTLNAAPLVPAIIEACERGIDVFCYICLGYNDTGELLPGQGGTNEMIVHKMYTELSEKGKQRLHYFWYIGADQTVPIVAKKKKRSCHVKVMIVDEHIGIQGNGNQDTQSWYHSQEINVMFDSATVCKAWIDGLRRNQNTHLYGPVDKTDGIWRDENGNQPQDVIGIDPGRFSWAKGFVGAIERVRGTGDF